MTGDREKYLSNYNGLNYPLKGVCNSKKESGYNIFGLKIYTNTYYEHNPCVGMVLMQYRHMQNFYKQILKHILLGPSCHKRGN